MLFALPALNAEQFNSSAYKIIGFNMYQAHSASGYGRSLNLNMSIEKERRHLEAGIIMQLESAKISGGELLYRHYLSPVYKKDNSYYRHYRDLRFFFQYNLISRRHLLPDSFQTMPSTLQEVVVPGGRIATFEHYAGIGTLVRLFDNLFLNTSIGYGVIMGSIDDKKLDGAHNTMNRNKYDFGLITKFGLGYFFRK